MMNNYAMLSKIICAHLFSHSYLVLHLSKMKQEMWFFTPEDYILDFSYKPNKQKKVQTLVLFRSSDTLVLLTELTKQFQPSIEKSYKIQENYYRGTF